MHWELLLPFCMSACGNGYASTEGVGGATSVGGGSSGVASVAAGSPGSGGGPSDGGGAGGGATGSALDTGPGEFQTDFESSPTFVTRMREPMRGLASSPHQIMQIFYSSNIESLLGREAFDPVPEGTVAIKKQDRNGDGVIDQIMVMLKRPSGTDPPRGDWLFEQRDPNDYHLVSSSDSSATFRDLCAGCHAGFPSTDWLSGTSLSN